MKKLFGSINLKWPRLIAFAVIAGVYTGIMINADLTRTGKTKLILESPDGERSVFSLRIYRDSYRIEKITGP